MLLTLFHRNNIHKASINISFRYYPQSIIFGYAGLLHISMQSVLPYIIISLSVEMIYHHFSFQNLLVINLFQTPYLYSLLFTKFFYHLFFFQGTNYQFTLLHGYNVTIQALDYHLTLIGCMDNAVLAFIQSNIFTNFGIAIFIL